MPARDWHIDEDVVLLDMLKDNNDMQHIAVYLNRPQSAIAARLQFLENHEIIFGPDGSAALRRKDSSIAINSKANPVRVPRAFESATLQKQMNAST